MPLRRGKVKKPIPIAKELLLKSRKKARQITSQFHKLNNELESLENKERSLQKVVSQYQKGENDSNEVRSANKSKHVTDDKGLEILAEDNPDYNRQMKKMSETASRRKEVEKQLKELGGRSLYQRASVLSVSFHNTNKWVLSKLGELYRGGKLVSNELGEETLDDSNVVNLSILEIGAITPYLLDAIPRFPWLSYVHAIDLRSNHPKIKAIDYLDFDSAQQNKLHRELYQSFSHDSIPKVKSGYDVLICSMVINSVPEITARGAMLVKMAFDVTFHGIVFIMLPKSCLYNSLSFSMQTFHKLLHALGFQILEEKQSPKVYFVILRMENFYKTKGKNDFQELKLSMKEIRKQARKDDDKRIKANNKYNSTTQNKRWTTSFDIDF